MRWGPSPQHRNPGISKADHALSPIWKLKQTLKAEPGWGIEEVTQILGFAVQCGKKKKKSRRTKHSQVPSEHGN